MACGIWVVRSPAELTDPGGYRYPTGTPGHFHYIVDR